MKDWAELADEYRDLELRHKEYREVGYQDFNQTMKHPIFPKVHAQVCVVHNSQTLEKCMALQKKCTSGVTHQVCNCIKDPGS